MDDPVDIYARVEGSEVARGKVRACIDQRNGLAVTFLRKKFVIIGFRDA